MIVVLTSIRAHLEEFAYVKDDRCSIKDAWEAIDSYIALQHREFGRHDNSKNLHRNGYSRKVCGVTTNSPIYAELAVICLYGGGMNVVGPQDHPIRYGIVLSIQGYHATTSTDIPYTKGFSSQRFGQAPA